MTTSILKSTTAVLVALTVAAPAPLMAQAADGSVVTEQAQDLSKEAEKAAKELEKELRKKAGEETAEASEGAEPATEDAAEAGADGSIETPAEGDQPATVEADAAANAETPAPADQAAPEAAAAAEQPATSGPAAPAGDGDAAVAEVTPAEPAAGAPAAETAAEAAPEQPAAEATAGAAPEQPAAETTAEAAPEQPAAEATAETTPEQPAAEATAEAAPEQPAAETTAETAPEQPAADTTAETAPQPAPGDGTNAMEEVAQDEPTEPARQDPAVASEATTEQPAASATAEAAPAPTPEQQAQAQAEAEAARAQQEAQSMAASAAQDQAEVQTQTVTEDTARSSGEEFSNSVDANVTAQAEDDDGLSDAQKIGLLGLGGVALAAILDNYGDRVVSNSGDRIVVEENGQYRVLKDDDVLIRQPGTEVQTYSFQDGSTRTVATREDGTQIETVRAADGRVLSRTRILPSGEAVVLFDDTQQAQAVDVNQLPQVTESRPIEMQSANEEALRAALQSRMDQDLGRTFSLSQVRNINAVRRLVPEIEVDTINFETGSATIRPEEAEELAALGTAMRDAIEQNPREVFLVEGHTDAVGAAGYNLALSDRRAESVALALTEYFQVPPENMIVQGYGESDLKVQTTTAERENRRAAVRRITALLGQQG